MADLIQLVQLAEWAQLDVGVWTVAQLVGLVADGGRNHQLGSDGDGHEGDVDEGLLDLFLNIVFCSICASHLLTTLNIMLNEYIKVLKYLSLGMLLVCKKLRLMLIVPMSALFIQMRMHCRVDVQLKRNRIRLRLEVATISAT